MSVASTSRTEPCIACGQAVHAETRSRACEACGLVLVVDDHGVLSPPAGKRVAEVSYPEGGADVMSTVEETSFWFAHRNEVLGILLDRFAPSTTLWDVGGGNGFQAAALARRGRSVVLVEPGEAGCRNAVARGVPRVVHATIESLELRGGSLDAISLLDVIEHLFDPVTTLKECRRVLRPTGRLFITVPAYQALWSDEDDLAEHHRRYDRALLEEHLGAAGLRPSYVSYFFQPLVLPILLLRAAPYRLRPRSQIPATTDVSEHGTGGLGTRLVASLLRREANTLRSGRTLAFGSSLVAVAEGA